MADYIPRRGDIIWLQHNPQSGSEQAGHRPALVLSAKAFAKKTGLAMVCPITSTERPWPFHIRLPETNKTTGFVLADQAKCLDWRTRNAAFIEKAPVEFTELIQATVVAIIEQ